MSQTQFAPILGLGQAALSLKLRGRRGWGADEVIKTARYFDVSVAYLFGETENPHQFPDGGVSVGPAGIEPTTSTVEYGRLAEVIVGPWAVAA